MRVLTPSFIHGLALKTAPHGKAVLDVSMDAAKKIYNTCLQEPLRRLDLMRESKAYQAARTTPKGKEQTKERTLACTACRQNHAFYAYDIHAYSRDNSQSLLDW
jgi:hypothetical protein